MNTTRNEEIELARILRRGLVRTVFQPILQLETRRTVAAEALSRGPSGPLERPDDLFAAAREAGLTLRLDQWCVRRAVQSAKDLPDDVYVFVNIEPSSLADPSVLRLLAPLGDRVVVEVTERFLSQHPAEVLRALRHARAHGARVALDDVGVNPASVALLEFVRPEIVKLDLSLVQNQPSSTIGHIATAAMAYAERSGAVVLAEGIETEAHVQRALSMGATLGQGYLLGRPETGLRIDGALVDADRSDLPRCVADGDTARTPFGAIIDRKPTHTADTALLLEISTHLEHQAAHQSDLVLLGAFQHADRFTRATRRRYEKIARLLPFVAAIGVGLEPEPARGVRGATMAPDDPLAGEWAVIAMGPHYCGALIARDIGDQGDRLSRRFEYLVTHDRPTVARAALALMDRVVADSRLPG